MGAWQSTLDPIQLLLTEPWIIILNVFKRNRNGNLSRERITLRSGKCSEHARAVGVVVLQGIDITQSHGRLVA